MDCWVVLLTDVLDGLCEAEVRDLGDAAAEQDVLGLEVPVEDVAVVQELAAIDDISEDL